MRRLIAIAALTLSFAGVSVLAVPSTASAVSGPYMSSSGGHYGCTNMQNAGCNMQGTIPAGTPVTMHCWIDDSWATGAYSSNRWFYVTTSTGIRNFVHSSRVSRQVSVPNCKSHRGIYAARWASMHIGATRPSSSEKAGNAGMDRWSGWCYVLAWDAHALSHGAAPLRSASAKAAFYAYRDRGRVSTNLNPSSISIGSIVFWTNGTYGHAAIYVGQGMVVTTQGYGNSLPPVTRLPMNNFGTPAGWVSPSNI